MTLLNRLRTFFDPTREPLRRRVYTSLIPVMAVLVAVGWINDDLSTSIIALAGTLLMGGATEAARSAVTPVADPAIDDVPGKHAADTATIPAVSGTYPPELVQ